MSLRYEFDCAVHQAREEGKTLTPTFCKDQMRQAWKNWCPPLDPSPCAPSPSEDWSRCMLFDAERTQMQPTFSPLRPASL